MIHIFKDLIKMVVSNGALRKEEGLQLEPYGPFTITTPHFQMDNLH